MSKVLPESVYYLLPNECEFNRKYLVSKEHISVKIFDEWTSYVPSLFSDCQPVSDTQMLKTMMMEGAVPISEVLIRDYNDMYCEQTFMGEYDELYTLFKDVYVVEHYNMPRILNKEYVHNILSFDKFEYTIKRNHGINIIVAKHDVINTLMSFYDNLNKK